MIADVDDEKENRFSLVFQPYQAVRITTADCFIPPRSGVLSNTVMEVLSSSWIAELTNALSMVDETATFMSEARHFVVPLQDDFLEVVAAGIAVSDLIGAK